MNNHAYVNSFPIDMIFISDQAVQYDSDQKYKIIPPCLVSSYWVSKAFHHSQLIMMLEFLLNLIFDAFYQVEEIPCNSSLLKDDVMNGN